jgi:hypothetical protein
MRRRAAQWSKTGGPTKCIQKEIPNNDINRFSILFFRGRENLTSGLPPANKMAKMQAF